jgi:huntingtin interacting protein 1
LVYISDYKCYFTGIAEVCKLVGTSALNLLASIKNRNKADDVAGNVAAVKVRVTEVADLIEKLTDALKGDSAEMIGDLVESELASMDKAIEEAAGRIEVSIKSVVYYFVKGHQTVYIML